MKHRLLLLLAAAVVLIAAVLATNDNTLGTTEYIYASPRLPSAFDGLRIAQVSDLHNDDFGDPEILTGAVRAARPDLIVVTGDMIDANRTDVAAALDFAERFADIAPVYYSNGNHEKVPQYPVLVRGLRERGVAVLEDETVFLERGGDRIAISGVVDPFIAERPLADRLADTLPKDGSFSVLLSHRPEYPEAYADHGADLVFAGHAHGGQIRFPVIGPLYAPHQGLFPTLYEGMHTFFGTTMVISRGIGNSIFPLRINNPPELVVVTLRAE